MNVRMTPPQGPMGQPMPMGGAPAPMPPMGGPMPVPPMQPTAGQQQKQGLGSAFGGSAQGRGQFKNFMSAKKQTSALVPPMQASMQPMGSAPPMAQPRMAPQPMLPGPAPQMMGAMKPMGAPQMGGPVQAGRPMRGTQGGLGSAPVQLNRGGMVETRDGSEIPRSTVIGNEPHMLAYINPTEEKILRGIGGLGVPGPGGVPSYLFGFFSGGGNDNTSTSSDDSNDDDGGFSFSDWASDTWAEITSGGAAVTDTYNPGESASTSASTGGTDYSFMDANEEEDYNLGTGTDYSTAYDPFSNDDDDDDPVVTTTTTPTYTDTSSISGISDASGVDYTSGTDYSVLDANEEEDFNLGTGTTYDTVYDPFPADDDPDPVVETGSSGYPSLDATAGVNTNTSDTTGGYDPVGTGSVDDPATGTGTDYSILDPDPEEDFDLGTGTDYSEPYNPPADEPPAPPPVYYDMFGGEHATQEAANEADAAYTAASNAVDIVTGGASDGATGTDVDVDTGFTQQEIDASNNTAKLMNDYSAISDDYSTFQGNDLTKGSGNTIGYATGGSKAGYAAIINPVTGGIDILTPGSESVEASFAATELEDALNYLTDGDVDLTNLDAPLDLLPEVSGGTGTVGLDAEGRLIEYGVDDIEEMLAALEGVSDMTDEELAAIAGELPSTDVQIRDEEEDLNLFPVDIRDDEEDTGLFPVDIRDDEEDTDLFPASTIDYGGRDFRDVAPASSTITDTIKELEGFSDSTYYDVNAERGGYGSDTKTDPVTGEVTKIEPGMTVTREEAEADLNRRLTTEFIPSVVDAVGADTFYAMDPTTQAALTSIAYNYGSNWAEKLPSLAEAARTGDTDLIADAIADRSVDNDGINATRRLREAEMVRSGVPLGGDTDIYAGDDVALSGTASGAGTGVGGADTDIVTEVTGETGQTATEAYLSAMTKLDNPETMTEMEQRALYGARGQVPNAAETAYLTSLLRDAKHKEDVVNPETGEVIAKAGDYVVKQTGAEKFEDLIVKGIDFFLNPLTILGDKYSLENMNEAYVQEQLDAYRDGGTFVYDGAGTVVGIADANYDADGDGENDSVVLLGDDGEYTVTGGRIGVEDVENSNANADDDADIDDIDIVDSNVTYTNTEDGVVEQRVGGDEEQTGGDDPIDPCPEGFMLDPVLGECVPIDDVVAGSPSLSLREINRDTGGGTGGGGSTTPVVGDPLIIRAPQQFARGGPVDLDPNTYDFRGFDEDNPFNMSSVIAMQRHQVGLTPFDESQMELYDLNRDGSITEADTTAGLQYMNFVNDGVFDEQRANEQDFYLYTPPITLGARPTQQATTPSPVTQPVQQPVQGMAIRKPKQFNRGGAVTPNIDRFMQSLGA